MIANSGASASPVQPRAMRAAPGRSILSLGRRKVEEGWKRGGAVGIGTKLPRWKMHNRGASSGGKGGVEILPDGR